VAGGGIVRSSRKWKGGSPHNFDSLSPVFTLIIPAIARTLIDARFAWLVSIFTCYAPIVP
jgi:hypothetical protein